MGPFADLFVEVYVRIADALVTGVTPLPRRPGSAPVLYRCRSAHECRGPEPAGAAYGASSRPKCVASGRTTFLAAG